MQIGIVGIHTGIGKTVCSAVICQALEADYWKPIQAGEVENSDSAIVRRLVVNNKTKVHDEAFRFRNAISPHAAAKLENLEIVIQDINIPHTENHLIIETAGGLHSPVNEVQTMTHLILSFKIPVVLVYQNYLGSINHTLLTVEALRHSNIPVLGIVFNGDPLESSEEYILNYTNLNSLGSIPYAKTLNAEFISTCAYNLRKELNDIIR